MTFVMPEHAEPSEMASFYQHTLPQADCTACGRIIPRRRHRIYLRASWAPKGDVLCPRCWSIVCQWASRFALQQAELPL